MATDVPCLHQLSSTSVPRLGTLVTLKHKLSLTFITGMPNRIWQEGSFPNGLKIRDHINFDRLPLLHVNILPALADGQYYARIALRMGCVPLQISLSV